MQRFTISLEETLAREFDSWAASRGYANRSEAVRDLLRWELERAQQKNTASGPCVASLSYVFNHHERELAERLTSLQHAHHELTISSMHVHLDHEHCLETVILRGPTQAVQHFADSLMAERGVRHGKLNLVTVVEHQPHRHGSRSRSGADSSQKSQGAPHVHLRPAR
ncbi:MAG TPA: nickel-responsive transcriptional regulator NikR [Burkholderiaceae bacterium]|nr:nickel-responsive transcriptional regulator NikR [Burkholderiaceae bacterium]